VRQLWRSAGAMLMQSFGVVLHVAVAIAIIALYVSPWVVLITVAILLKPSWRRRIAGWWRRRRERRTPAA
jgi:hypothetical protein